MGHCHGEHPPIRDYGGEPFVFNIEHATSMNTNFRTALWTGSHLQLTLMCIPIGGDIGVEMHEDTDQFIRVEKGRAKVMFGTCRHTMCEKATIGEQGAILIPAGTWHNIVNVGCEPLKLYSLYAPPHHAFGTVNKQKPTDTCDKPSMR